MRPFIIDAAITESLKTLVEYAESNPFSMDDLLDVYNKQMPCAGDNPEYARILPFGYRIVYSIEKQVVGDVRHLSISVDADDKLPNMAIVAEIIKIIGFKNSLGNCLIKIEDTSPNRMAINVLEKIV